MSGALCMPASFRHEPAGAYCRAVAPVCECPPDGARPDGQRRQSQGCPVVDSETSSSASSIPAPRGGRPERNRRLRASPVRRGAARLRAALGGRVHRPAGRAAGQAAPRPGRERAPAGVGRAARHGDRERDPQPAVGAAVQRADPARGELRLPRREAAAAGRAGGRRRPVRRRPGGRRGDRAGAGPTPSSTGTRSSRA